MSTSGLIPNLQILRAFAAINVVVLHAILNGARDTGPGVLQQALGMWGGSGVDLFFVLSGFIMTYSQWERSANWRRFVYNRLTRIVPVYWFVTSSVVLLLLVVPGAFRTITIDFDRMAASYLFVTHFAQFSAPLVGPGWTLEYELVFYALFVLVLMPFRDRPGLALLALLLASVSVVYAGQFGVIFIEFWFGCLVGLAFRSLRIDRTIGLLVLVVGCLVYVATLLFAVGAAHRVLFWGLPAMAIVYGCATTWQWRNRALVFLGAASYSIYLVQTLTISGSYKVLRETGIDLHPDAAVVLATVATVVGGCALHLAVERPSLVRLRGGFVPEAIRGAAALGLARDPAADRSRASLQLPRRGLRPAEGYPAPNAFSIRSEQGHENGR